MALTISCRIVALFSVAVTTLTVTRIAAPAAAQGWVRSYVSEPAGPIVPLAVTSIRSVEGSTDIVGTFRYVNTKPSGAGGAPITLHGRKRRDGSFSPVVKAQVANQLDDRWSSIQLPSLRGRLAIETIAPSTQRELSINLSRFVNFIGKMKYGKVILESGDCAIIELTDLLPPQSKGKGKEKGLICESRFVAARL